MCRMIIATTLFHFTFHLTVLLCRSAYTIFLFEKYFVMSLGFRLPRMKCINLCIDMFSLRKNFWQNWRHVFDSLLSRCSLFVMIRLVDQHLPKIDAISAHLKYWKSATTIAPSPFMMMTTRCRERSSSFLFHTVKMFVIPKINEMRWNLHDLLLLRLPYSSYVRIFHNLNFFCPQTQRDNFAIFLFLLHSLY